MKTLRAMAPLLIGLFLLLGKTSVYADGSYTVDSRDVHIDLHTDGSADIVERIGFTIQGGLTNMPFQFAGTAELQTEIREIRFMREGEWVVCNLLSAGQWDNQVFSGSYSQMQQEDRLDVKVYGYFNAQRSNFVISYYVPQLVMQQDRIALMKRIVIFPNEITDNRNIRVHVQLPGRMYAYDAKLRVEGVIISESIQTTPDTLLFMVPDTVPGESVQVLAELPLELFDELRAVENTNTLPEPGLEELLKARELAAEKAGAEAQARVMLRRLYKVAARLADILTVIGLVAVLLYAFALRRADRKKKGKWMNLLANCRYCFLLGGIGYSVFGLTISLWFAFWNGYLMLIPAMLMLYSVLRRHFKENSALETNSKNDTNWLNDYRFDHR